MKITVIGTGYVGLVTGVCFAEMGNDVTCVDTNHKKIEDLKKGILPIYEPGLDDIVKRNYAIGRLHFVTSLNEQPFMPEVYFIAVGTPSSADGSAELRYVFEAARNIGKILTDYAVIIDKSTVPVGTAEQVKQIIQEELNARKSKVTFDVVSNPEFLKEGSAILDCMRPDRVIIGSDSKRAIAILHELYAPFTRNHERTIVMGVRDAEMTKYTANSMLALKISFMNEIANICERLNVDVENVRLGIGSDSRIGFHFIYPGCGYGGSCFPKDLKALAYTAKQIGFDPLVLNAVMARNDEQKKLIGKKIVRRFGEDLSGITIGLWGLAFKPATDDIRDAPAIIFLHEVISRGARVRAFDPEAMPSAKKELPENWFTQGKLTLVEHQEDVWDEADVFVLMTEWKQFRSPNFEAMKKRMKGRLIIDGRNQYDPKKIKELGFEYEGIGRHG